MGGDVGKELGIAPGG